MKRSFFILISGYWLLASGFSPAIVDLNSNGLSDLWEKEHNAGELFPETFDPQGNYDADGWNNMEEAAAGTDPYDANPPDGSIRPITGYVPAVMGEQNGVLIIITPEVITVSWPTLAGKQYTLKFSADLSQGSWISVGDPFIASGGEVTYNFEIDDADKRFWRVAVNDVDTDGDGLTDYEEDLSGSNSATADSDGDGLTDSEEAALGTDPNSPDTDDDELGDAEDAVPLDGEINWPKTPESKYVWIGQVTGGGAKAVSRHGHIMFPYSNYGTNGSNLQYALWDSVTSNYVTLAGASSWSGSGFLADTAPFDAEWNHIDDMNDEGIVVGRSKWIGLNPSGPPPVFAYAVMKWQMSGTATDQYAAPIYIVPGFEHTLPWGQLEETLADDVNNVPRIADDGTISALSWHEFYNPPYTYITNTHWVASDAQIAGHVNDMALWSNLGTQDQNIQYRSGAVIGASGGLLVEHRPSIPKTILHYRNGAAAESLEGLLPSTAYGITNTDIGRTPATSESSTGRIWFSVNHTGGDAAFLEKRDGGSGVSRWHNPPSMGEGAIRLNTQGLAITGGKPATQTAAAIPPKLWRNGKYTDLNDEKLTSKPSTVTITKAIDLASNGIILAQATENGVTKTGLLLPVEIVNYEKKPVSELVVADMEESLTQGGELVLDGGVATGFAGDPDRFYVRIPNLQGNHTVTVKLSTVENPDTSYNDDPTELKLYPVDGGYESKSQALVSGVIDAEIETLENITPDNPEPISRHKRTHNVQLGGKVRITDLVIDGTALPLDFKIPVPVKKTVHLNFVVIDDAEAPDITAELKSANEIYASTGIKLEKVGEPVTKPPLPGLPGQSSSSELNDRDISDLGRYISHYGTTNTVDDIHVFYVKRVGYYIEGYENMFLDQGYAIIDKSPGTMSGEPTPTAKDTGDANNVFIGNVRATFMVLAHEVCHVLTNEGHYGTDYASNVSNRQESHNLMSGTTRNHSETNTITAKKRIYEMQREMIFNHWFSP